MPGLNAGQHPSCRSVPPPTPLDPTVQTEPNPGLLLPGRADAVLHGDPFRARGGNLRPQPSLVRLRAKHRHGGRPRGGRSAVRHRVRREPADPEAGAREPGRPPGKVQVGGAEEQLRKIRVYIT